MTEDDWVILNAVNKEVLTEEEILKKVHNHRFEEPTVFAEYLDRCIRKGYLNRQWKNGKAHYFRVNQIK
ncbi:hypothetical protein [Pseudanabaena sp. 'Roaring Creek']|uniref:hypothetical protein n=1 Tax=Pseudanabaena sp. 'Roaring Creek' TaxID=1681830 RepID=UPI0012E1D6C0|nr:hypothetical protein [Pseudanabaena sp. 'Roaring Creek']